ncbi:MAG: apolipoprotein N-acyltransferase [Myxococcales bacterium]|nr:apolipoprotein N-acyltransferase [Myxococcales bacterium]
MSASEPASPPAAPPPTAAPSSNDRRTLADRPVPKGLAAAGAFLSGLLYFLAFPGVNLWPLAIVAFVPFYVVLLGQTPRRAAWLGLLQGTTMNATGFYWLMSMLKTFSGFPAPICAFFVLVVAAFQGGRSALHAWLFARVTQRGVAPALAFAGTFVAAELTFPVLFTWYFGGVAHDTPALAQVADLGGPILVGLALIGANLALAELVVARLEARSISRRIVGIGAGGLAATVLYGAVRIGSVDARAAASEPLHVGIVQGNLGLMQKREDPAEGLRRHKRLTQELRQKGAELVVWSESSVTFAVPENVHEAFMKNRVSAGAGVPMVFGAVVYRSDPDRERWFNTALSSNAQGDITARYDKHYLLAFGEYLPFGEELPILHKWSPNSGRFSKGKEFRPLLFSRGGKDYKLGTLICYEDILPRFTSDLVNQEDPDLLVNITNDAWFGDTLEPWQHLALAKFRAIEHRRYLVRATNSGVSAIVDPVGRTMAHTPTFKPATVDTVVHFMRGQTVYAFLGDVPWLLVTLLMFGFALRPLPGLQKKD